MKAKFIFIPLALITLILAASYLYDLSFNGNQAIHFLPSTTPIESLEALAAQPQLRGKVLYIDIWGTRCGPCLDEFKHLPALKARFKDQSPAFVYLGAPYGYYNDVQLWKKKLKKHQLHGYHYHMSQSFYNQVWTYPGIRDTFSIPHYILIDKTGHIAHINAARPSNPDTLYQQIIKLL